MIKVMRRKWFTFKLTSKMYEAFSISHEQSQAFFKIVERRFFVPTSAEPNLFELCRVQPKIMK